MKINNLSFKIRENIIVFLLVFTLMISFTLEIKLEKENSLSKNSLVTSRRRDDSEQQEGGEEGGEEGGDSAQGQTKKKEISLHYLLGKSLIARFLVAESSISYYFEKEDKSIASGSYAKVNNDMVYDTFKKIFDCSTKKDSLKKMKDAFDTSFKEGIKNLVKMGKVSITDKFSYELNPEHKNEGNECEKDAENNKVEPRGIFDYKGGRGNSK